MLAKKYNEDKNFKFDFYSKVARINIKQLGRMEFILSHLIKYKFYVNENEYNEYFHLTG